MKTLKDCIDEAFDQNTQKQYVSLLAKYEKLATDMQLQNDVKMFQALINDVNESSKPKQMYNNVPPAPVQVGA